MAAELLSQAKSSEERGENEEQVKWLSRYVRLVPSDVESLASLAFVVDSQETGPKQNVEFARSRLATALVACGDNPEFEELRTSLRRRLIPRLLQYGSEKAPEVEKHIILLSAKETDAEAIKWLAQSLLIQRNDSEYLTRDAKKYDKESHFWNWIASQPTGQVLRKAAEANPDDVDLAYKLLMVCNQLPAWFSAENESFPKEQLAELTDQTLERLSVKKDDGHAQYVVYSYAALSDQEKANSILAEAVDSALVRLSAFVGTLPAENGINDSAQGEPKGSQEDFQSNAGHLASDYDPYWDWQIALERSRVVDGSDAERICEKLSKLATEKIATKQREEVFLRLAALRMEKGQYAEAIEICKSGLSTIKQSSLLYRSIASANLKLEKTEEADTAINELESDTELRLRQLDGALGLGMPSSEKAAARQQIAAEQWNARVLRGQLALVEKNYVKAAKLLRDSYKTSISIPAENRIEAGLLLALCYSKTEQWDLVGQIYDECSVLRPKDRSISLAAVNAWRRAGSPELANEQIAGLDDGSFSAALARVILLISKPASQIEKREIIDAIKIARKRFDAVPVEERLPLEPWRLELLEIRFESVDAKEPKEREQDSLSRLEAIAEKYADVAELQSQAAVDLAALRRTDASNRAIGRLELIAERTQSVEDRVNFVLTKTRVFAVNNETESALKLLDSATKSMPDQAIKFAKVAAQIEIRANRIDKAYTVMRSVPEENLDFEAALMLAGIVDNLKAVDAAKADELTNKLDSWISRNKQEEGEDGTSWRYLTAERLVAKISVETNAKQLLELASRYYKEIDALRPHWGLASALGAKIASIRAQMDGLKASEEAIGLWRRAIRDGDNRVGTVLDLVRELNSAERGDQAEAELQRISSLADSVVPISAWAVSFALKRGDFSEARVRAEQLTTRKPEDVNGWLLRAQTTFAASSSLGLDDVSQSKLRDEAWSFLEKAHSLSRGKNLGVWDARFRFKLLTGDKPGAAALLEEILREPSLGEEVRFMEAGRRYLTLKEYGLARKCFDNCLLLNPRAADVYLGLADLNSAIGDTEESLNSLRKAHQVAPKNQEIRDRLAINLAFSKNEKPENIDWKEIDTLLTSAALPSTPRSTIVGALIALGRGDKERQSRAVKTLREISQSSTPERNDAKRLLANYFELQWSTTAKENQRESSRENFQSARQLYEELLDETRTNPNDAARYVSLLLKFVANAKETKLETGVDYLAIADRALTKLESASGSSIASLQLRIRLAKSRGEESTVGSIAEKWVVGAGDLETLGMQNLWEIAGQTLMRLGFSKESIYWLEKVYEKDPKKYALLVTALAREQNFERAIELCVKAYQLEPSPIAATLIAEVAMMQSDSNLQAEASQVLKQALTEFGDSADLLEAMGTLQLMQRRLPEAVTFYETAEKKDPKRRRTLNNLAMALSEMPMRRQDALAKIEKAIAIYGRDPDLLDTLGQVLFRNGRLQEGLATLTEACGLRDDVSFRIHLAQVLVAMKDHAAAKEQWSKIKQSKLDGVVLTPEDKEVLALLNSQFGEKL